MGSAKKNAGKRPSKRTRKKRGGKHPGGRPPFKFNLQRVRQLASLGLSVEDIARIEGCCDRTAWRKLAGETEFSQAYQKGISQRNMRLWSNLNTLSGTKAAAAIFLAKNWLGLQSEPSMPGSGPLTLGIVIPPGCSTFSRPSPKERGGDDLPPKP